MAAITGQCLPGITDAPFSHANFFSFPFSSFSLKILRNIAQYGH